MQKSLAWCQGTPEYPGIRRRLYFIAKTAIAEWPQLPKTMGRPTSAVYMDSFVLKADQFWHYIDVLPDKCQVTSEAQGELPSQTQLNKLTAVHPGVDYVATEAAAFINNADNVFVVEDMKGMFRVVGSELWMTKTTVTQDLGQGATGTASTTINAEATDVVPAPFYFGKIELEDGTEVYPSGLATSEPRDPDMATENTDPAESMLP